MHLFSFLSLAAAMIFLSGCSYPVTMISLDGEKYSGRYRFAREDSGLMQIHGPEDEVLIGRFVRVDRTLFAQGYEKAFGRGTIETDGPDLSRYGNAFAGVLGTSSAFHETAYAEPVAGVSPQEAKSVSGPLFYWIASLQGDRRLVLGCYLVGSAFTGKGFGRCKSQSGKEYLVDF